MAMRNATSLKNKKNTTAVYENLQLCHESLTTLWAAGLVAGGHVDRGNGNLFPMRLYCSCCFFVFSPPRVHSLNTIVTQPCFVLVLDSLLMQHPCCCWNDTCVIIYLFFTPKMGDGDGTRDASSLCARAVLYVALCIALYVRGNEGSSHSSDGGITLMKSLEESRGILILGEGGGGCKGGARSLLRSGTRKWWIINKGKGTMFLMLRRLTPARARRCTCVFIFLQRGRSLLKK